MNNPARGYGMIELRISWIEDKFHPANWVISPINGLIESGENELSFSSHVRLANLNVKK